MLKTPAAISRGEKKYWKEVESILYGLLDELKANDKIEIFFMKSESEHMKHVLQTLQRLGTDSNWLTKVVQSKKAAEKFLKAYSHQQV